MWSNKITTKILAVLTTYFLLILLRKTILSLDVRILRWFLRDVKFPPHTGQTKGFFSLGEIQYNLTENTLGRITVEHSNIDTSNLWELTHTGKRYLNIALHNANANFRANWAYFAWPSFGDRGRLTMDLSNASLQLTVEISTNQTGFINLTARECIVRIMSIDLQFYHEQNMMFDSIKPSLKKKAESALPNGLCKAIRQGLLKYIRSMVQNIQHKFVNHILSGEVENNQNLTSTLGWIVVYTFIIAVKVLHDCGLTLLLVLVLLSMYFIYDVLRCRAIMKKCMRHVFFKRQNKKVRSLSDPEPYSEQERRVFTRQLSVTVVSRSGDATAEEQRNSLMLRIKKLLWWRKPKEN